MSRPSYAECSADGYELALENLLKDLGREPTDDELQAEYEAICDAADPQEDCEYEEESED